MIYKLLADTVVIIHFGFILYVIFGGLLLFWDKRLIWIHLVAVVWAAILELFGWICPLTYLEAWLRQLGGSSSYPGGFVEHYILPVIYPAFLTRQIQIYLGLLVIIINLMVYAWVYWGYRSLKQV